MDVDTTKWRVTQAMLELEIAKVKNVKAEHSGEKGGAEAEDWVLLSLPRSHSGDYG